MLEDYYRVFGYHEAVIDPKNRVMLPARYGINKGDDLIVFPKKDYYLFVMLKWLKEKLAELEEIRTRTTDKQLAAKIERDLRIIYSSVISPAIKVTSERRIVLPSNIRDNFEDTLPMLGQGYKFAAFPNHEVYERFIAETQGEVPQILK